MTEARLILICGLPGSGKTMLAKQLAPKLRAVRFCPDEWKHDLGIDYYDEQRRVRLEARLWRLGQELLRLGQSVILENGFWTRGERDELRLAARALGVPVELQYLEVPVDELWRRLEIRNELAPAATAPIRARRSSELGSAVRSSRCGRACSLRRRVPGRLRLGTIAAVNLHHAVLFSVDQTGWSTRDWTRSTRVSRTGRRTRGVDRVIEGKLGTTLAAAKVSLDGDVLTNLPTNLPDGYRDAKNPFVGCVGDRQHRLGRHCDRPSWPKELLRTTISRPPHCASAKIATLKRECGYAENAIARSAVHRA